MNIQFINACIQRLGLEVEVARSSVRFFYSNAFLFTVYISVSHPWPVLCIYEPCRKKPALGVSD